MANPQTNKGYARLANELAQGLYRYPFSGCEMRVAIWVIRHSYGWGRKDTMRTLIIDIAKDLRMPDATVSWAIKGLTRRGVLLRMEVSGGLRLNKNYDEWMPRAGRGQLSLTANTDKKRKGPSDAPIKKTARRPQQEFVRPTLEQVQAYCAERKSIVDPAKFWNHYESTGWISGRHQTPVTNWKSLVCYWERSTHQASAGGGKPCPLCEGPLPYPNAIVCERCGARCRACNTETPNLRIVKRRDGTKTAECANGCQRTHNVLTRAAMPNATKNLEAEKAKERFMADHRQRMAAREKT